MMLRAFLFFAFAFLPFILWSQVDTIYLDNPSFEDTPRHSKPPRGWFDCGFPGESPPDVHPSYDQDGFFNVKVLPLRGSTYMGMVVRDNDTWEMVSTKLSAKLKAGEIYKQSIHLCRSELYVSLSRLTLEPVNYTTPVKLRIWGGVGHCARNQLLVETAAVVNTSWMRYDLYFKPDEDYQYLFFEAFYVTPTLYPYNGNILLDEASAIVRMDAAAIAAYEKNGKSLSNPIANEPDQPHEVELKKYPKYNPLGTFTPVENNSDIDWDPDPVPATANAEVGKFTEPIRLLWEQLQPDLEQGRFRDTDKASLERLVQEIINDGEYEKLVIGIMGKKKRRKMLMTPWQEWLEEHETLKSHIFFEEVPYGQAESKWVAKNKYYRVRLD